MRILFAHGAGLGSASDWMTSWAGQLGALGTVTAFDYPYMAAGKRRPDRHPVLLEAHREALAACRGDEPVVLMGKSMGSRIGCHLALEEQVHGLVCFGYPLVGMGKTRAVRDQVLVELRTPILFVQGTRDRLCPLEVLAEVRGRMTAPSELHVVDGGDHSLRVGKRLLKTNGETQNTVDARVLETVRTFVEALPT